MKQEKSSFGRGAQNKRLNNLILSQKIVEIPFPEFKEENKYLAVSNDANIEMCYKIWNDNLELLDKKWDYIFYLESGIKIHSDISPMLNIMTENKTKQKNKKHTKQDT